MAPKTGHLIGFTLTNKRGYAPRRGFTRKEGRN